MNRILNVTCLSLLLMSSSYAENLYKPEARTVGYKDIVVDLGGEYFQTQGYFDIDGNETEIVDTNSYTRMDGIGTIYYGISKNFDVRFGMRGRSVESKTGEISETGSGLESYFGGVKYAFDSKSSWKFAIDGMFRQSALSYDREVADNTELLYGETGSELTLLGHVAYAANENITLSGSGGFRNTFDDLSDEIVLNGELGISSASFMVFGGVEAIVSLENGKYSSEPNTKPNLNFGNTSQFNSVNRSYMMPYAGLGFGVGSVTLEGKVGQVMSGTSTDKGMSAMVSLKYTKKSKHNNTTRKLNKFKSYEIDSSIIKLSPRGKFVKIDQGISSDITKGMKFDIYKTDFFGGNILVATGVAHQVGSDWTIIKLLKKYKNIKVEVGFAARGY